MRIPFIAGNWKMFKTVHESVVFAKELKSVVKDVSFTTIFKGVLPFILTDIVRLIILIAFPVIALWLPSRM